MLLLKNGDCLDLIRRVYGITISDISSVTELSKASVYNFSGNRDVTKPSRIAISYAVLDLMQKSNVTKKFYDILFEECFEEDKKQ